MAPGSTVCKKAPELLAQNSDRSVAGATSDLPRLFHQLNNQLGIILANAELLERRLIDETQRARAGQVVTSAVEAIATAQQIRQLAVEPD
jgi:hypothetical protein